MVSDFIEEHNGYLRLTAEEFEAAKGNYPSLTRHQARGYLVTLNTGRTRKVTGPPRSLWLKLNMLPRLPR